MAFSLTSRTIILEGSILKAHCRNLQGFWVPSTIDLDRHLGNIDGSFNMSGTNFSRSAESVRLVGTIITASLIRQDSKRLQATLDLNVCIQNIDGQLRFKKPRDSLLLSSSCLLLDGTRLKGLCLGMDGKMHASEIDLNDHYGNSNGEFKSGDKSFVYTARNLSLHLTTKSITLRAELRGWDSQYKQAEVDLSICIVNHYGGLVFVKHDGWFDRDGFFASFFEKLPVVGFIVAALQFAAGNEDHAARAIAYCANSTTVMVGITIGTCLGGPIGAMIRAGLATPIGILAEMALAGYLVHDPRLKAQFEEATIGRFLYESLRNALGTGAAAYFAAWLAHAMEGPIQAALGEVSKISKVAGEVVVNFATYAMLKKVLNALKGGSPLEEWKEVEERVAMVEHLASHKKGIVGQHRPVCF